jgi:hypothetical protein
MDQRQWDMLGLYQVRKDGVDARYELRAVIAVGKTQLMWIAVEPPIEGHVSVLDDFFATVHRKYPDPIGKVAARFLETQAVKSGRVEAKVKAILEDLCTKENQHGQV